MFLGGVIFEAHTLSGYDEFSNLPADSSRPTFVGADFEMPSRAQSPGNEGFAVESIVPFVTGAFISS